MEGSKDYRRQAALIARNNAAKADGRAIHELESVDPGSLPPPEPAAIAARVRAVAERMPRREVPDRDAFERALRIIAEAGSEAVRRLVDDPTTLTPGDGAALEAVIFADGSRPSFLLEGGLPPEDHPLIGSWSADLAVTRPFIAKVAKAVGRLQPLNGHASRFVGTGMLVPGAAEPLVLTNFHVLEDARTKHFVGMEAEGGRWRITGHLEIDFVAEAASLETQRFKVVEALLPAGAGPGPSGLDAVVLRLETPGDPALPAPVKLSAAPALANGGASSLCTIGFPATPTRTFGVVDGIDWGWVVTTLFGGAMNFGFKRLAPGRFYRALGFDPADSARRAFGHDATTLGGASGSPVIAWKDTGPPCFALHFSGGDGDTNEALAFARARAELEAVGMDFG